MGQDRDLDPDLAAGITPSLTRRSLLRTALGGWVNRCVNVSGGILPLLG